MNWIDINDKKPRCTMDVLFTNGDEVCVGWIEAYEEKEDPVFWDPIYRESYDDVTHWMPLPKPPES